MSYPRTIYAYVSSDVDIFMEIKYSNNHKIQESILNLIASSVNTHNPFSLYHLLNNSEFKIERKEAFIKL